jgi:hypothetical protein
MRWNPMTVIPLLLVSPVTASAQGGATFDPLVYRAAVTAVMGGTLPTSMAIGPVTVRLRVSDEVVMRGGQVNERLHQFDEIPVGLPERLDQLSMTTRPAGQLSLPPGFAVLDDSSAALLEADRWRELRRRTQAPRGVVHLTPVAYSTDGGVALVGVDWRCGPGCRQMLALWLVPDGSGGWSVKGSHRLPLN